MARWVLEAGSGEHLTLVISFNLNGTAIPGYLRNMRTDLDGVTVTAIVSGATGVTAPKVGLPGSSGSYRIRCFAADGRDITVVSAPLPSPSRSVSTATPSLMQRCRARYDGNSAPLLLPVLPHLVLPATFVGVQTWFHH